MGPLQTTVNPEAALINKLRSENLKLRLCNVRARLLFNPLTTQKNKSGVALLLALTSLMFMVYLASEVTRDSAVEYIVNSQELNRVKAYYAARNGMQIALLRVKIFQQVSQGSLPDAVAPYVDQIWKFPFAWPLPIPADLNQVDKGTIAETVADSLMDTTYTHTIEDEGSKIDLNDMASPSKVLRESTRKQVLNIFEQKMASDDDFKNKHANDGFEVIVNNIYDWMSDSNTSVGGGDKRSTFSALGTGYPPNRGFRTLEELKLVPGMTEELYKVLAPRVTIYGMKAINPNTASKEVLMALDTGMTEEAVNEAIAKRDDPAQGPFKGKAGQGGDAASTDPNSQGPTCVEGFKTFLEGKGARLSDEFVKIPMVCDKTFNFKITSTGLYGAGKSALQKTIVAYVMDLNKSASQVKSYLDKEKEDLKKQQQQQNPGQPPPTPTPSPSTGAPPKEPLPKGAPRVVYWTEY